MGRFDWLSVEKVESLMKIRSIKKIVIPLAVISILVLVVIGFLYRREISTYIEYGDFLRNSLGSYRRIDTTRGRRSAFLGGDFTTWTLEYQRANGEVRTLEFTYWSELTNAGSGTNLSHAVVSSARQIVKDDIINIAQEHFTFVEETCDTWDGNPLQIIGYDNTSLNIWIGCYEGQTFPRLDPTRVLDARNGIQLNSLTPYDFLNDWELDVLIRIFVNDHSASPDEMKERLKALVREVAQTYHISMIRISFSHIAETSIRGYYFLETDTFDTMLTADYRAQQREKQEEE